MHHQHSDPRFLWMTLAILVMTVCLCATETPKAAVVLAIVMAAVGILGWFQSKELESPRPWVVRLVSTVMIILGGAFLIWYFSVGRTLFHPILDIQKVFNSINASLVTPAPTK